MSSIRPSAPGDRGERGRHGADIAPVADSADPSGGPPAPPGALSGHPGTGRMQLRRLVVSSTAGVVARCRDFAREALDDWGWLPANGYEEQAVVDDVLLVVSELVTNACLHAGGPREMRLRGDDRTLRIEVADSAAAQPEQRTPHHGGRPGGHGVFIVARLSAGWGVVPHEGGGKTVWVDMVRGR